MKSLQLLAYVPEDSVMLKLYVGCALTQAPAEFRDAVAFIKANLREDFEVLEFLGLTAGTAEDVYLWDIHQCVAMCDVFVAITDLPSIGLGYEMGTAVEQLGKPTLAVAQQDAKITRLVLGINKPHFTFARYNTLDEVPDMVRKFVRTLATN